MSHYFTSEDSRHYVLANLLCKSWLLMAIDQWFKHTHSVIYYTNINIVMSNYFTSEKIRHYVLDNLLC